jgi:inorganic pyrophosphatase
MRLDRLPPFAGKKSVLRAVVETPKGSRNKYAYDPELKAMTLRKTLPEGMVFPFDFGFVPRTKGEDGDPLDILLLMDASACPGCVVECRLIGLIEAEQIEESRKERNDRLIAVATSSLEFQEFHDVSALPKRIEEQLEEFFVNYNRLAGKKFKVLRTVDRKAAMKMLRSQLI